jgi:hypothetical protein
MGNDLETKHQVDQYLIHIDELINNGQVDNAYKKYIELVKKVEGKEYESNRSIKADVYASYAYFLFRVSEYEEFYKMLIQAQDYGYSRDEIENVLWEAFIEPNMKEFESRYETNLKLLCSNGYHGKSIDFQQLPYWLLPTGVPNEYYMYDKEQKLIAEKISLYKYRKEHLPPPSDAFADYLLLDSWDWSSILTYTYPIKNLDKKTYVVLNNIEKFLSCIQGALLNNDIISNVFIFDSLTSMSEYFLSCNAFLPRNIINRLNTNENAKDYIDKIHHVRTNKDNRSGDQVLLSICIPSYNRGKRAYDNVVHLLQSYYDEEIEIVLSNNGTQNNTSEYYDKIRDIDDARLTYYAFEENQGFALNLSKACELARGKFILLVSDEDLVRLNVLDRIMNMLRESKETLAIVKTSTSDQSKPPSISTQSAGKDALLTFMLSSNYMSGIILNNALLKQHKGLEYIKDNLENNSICYWYPHMYLELLLSQYGNVQGTDIILITEGAAEKIEVEEKEISGSEIKIPYYATIEGRLEQHDGFTKIFTDLDKCKEDPDLLREMYLKLCLKTMFLFRISINAFYRKTDHILIELLDRAYHFCSSADFYKANINNNRSNYRRDLEEITRYYEHYKKQI